MEHILKIESHQLKNNLLSSYKCLNKLSCDFKQIHNSTVIVDFSNVTFISGNFFSIIGNIFSTYSIENELSIKIANLDRNIANVMCKNGFGKYFKNMKPKRDDFGTVIPFTTKILNPLRIILPHMFFAITECLRCLPHCKLKL